MNQRQRGEETPSRGPGLTDHAKKKLEDYRRARDSQQQGSHGLTSHFLDSDPLRIQEGYLLAMNSVLTPLVALVIFKSDLTVIHETVDMIVSNKHLEMGGTQPLVILLAQAAIGVELGIESGMRRRQEHQESGKILMKMLEVWIGST